MVSFSVKKKKKTNFRFYVSYKQINYEQYCSLLNYKENRKGSKLFGLFSELLHIPTLNNYL